MTVPSATYRIQFNRDFGFQAVEKLIPYLADLGISCVYASPIFRARKGSLHGYDVVDPDGLNPELGSPGDFERLKAVVHQQNMQWLQDVVPNHMAFDHENHLLMDVLEKGGDSAYHDFFDIDWEHPLESLKGKLLAPFLGEHYSEALEKGAIRLRYDEGSLRVSYYDRLLPLAIDTYADVLTFRFDEIQAGRGEDQADFIRFRDGLYRLNAMVSNPNEQKRDERIGLAKLELWKLYRRNQAIRRLIDANIEMYNGGQGGVDRFQKLDGLLSRQVFRLSYWKVANEEINYRRFFHINDLISLRMHDESVFDRFHALIVQLMEEGPVTGLRVDHVDGLRDPTAYLKRLRAACSKAYLVVEKILDSEEDLPSAWPVEGTTGYDFMNMVNGLFCRSENEVFFSRIYSSFAGVQNYGKDCIYEQKKRVIARHMQGDVDNLARLLRRMAAREPAGHDLTFQGLRSALVEIAAHFPVYRTYIGPEGSRPTDRMYVQTAAKRARRGHSELACEFDYIVSRLLAQPQELSSSEEVDRLRFVQQFQQFTAPLMAKGFEDTFLYRYNRLLSLNEVGGNPRVFGRLPEELHAFNCKRAMSWPHALNTTATHDTKRGEDVRARINVLSELPDEWQRHLTTWRDLNTEKKKRAGGKEIPDDNDEYFLYQTLIGSFPLGESEFAAYIERVKAYGIKAVREAKIHSGWLEPNAEYEDGYAAFIERILASGDNNRFLKSFLPFCRKIAHYGMLNSLSQTLIKITSPGLPDFYQGTELWDLNLVDPDNRRPVDFEKRKSFLKEIQRKIRIDLRSTIEELLAFSEDGRVKLFLIQRALEARRRNQEIFTSRNCLPLKIEGRFKDHIIAFARFHGGCWCLTIVPRFLTPLLKEGEYPLGRRVWGDTQVLLPQKASSRWQNIFTGQIVGAGRTLPVAETLSHFPVAMLISCHVNA